MTQKIIYKYGEDNIFDFYFMNDFTTILSLIEKGENVNHLKFIDEDDFYCYSEKKVYSEKKLFEKFNIIKVL